MTSQPEAVAPPDTGHAPVPQPQNQDPERMSAALRRLLSAETGPRVTIASLFQNIGERAHATLLILFALPNTLPGIPGTSAVMGVPLVYLTAQMALGRAPWLPGFITNRSIARDTLVRLVEKGLPWIERGEAYLRPRLQHLAGPRAERFIGLLSILLALSIMLPIPLGNMLPALAIIFFALGLMEDDGAWVIGGLVTAALALALVVFVMWAVIKSAIFVVLGAFGLG